MAKNQGNTIIIKRITKKGGGHQSGAWKVAYADFVTAMMAFFLLMWLLNATEAENLAGLADYFAPTVGVKDEMGIGFRGGKAALSQGIGADRNTNKGVVFGGVPTGPITRVTEKIQERTDNLDQEQVKIDLSKSEIAPTNEEPNNNNGGNAETPEQEKQMQEVHAALQSYAKEQIDKRWEDGSIEIRRTPEGLAIDIKDLDGESMFVGDTASFTDKLKDAIYELSKILRKIPNNLAIIGNTSSAIIQSKIPNYTKWELSADRANATRSYLEKNGVQKEQFSRIEGRADNTPFDRRRPDASINNRISIIILNQNDTPSHKKSLPDTIFNRSSEKDYIKRTIKDE